MKLQVGNIKNKKIRKSGLTDLFDSPKQKRLCGSDSHVRELFKSSGDNSVIFNITEKTEKTIKKI